MTQQELQLHNAKLKAKSHLKYPDGYIFQSDWHENKHHEMDTSYGTEVVLTALAILGMFAFFALAFSMVSS